MSHHIQDPRTGRMLGSRGASRPANSLSDAKDARVAAARRERDAMAKKFAKRRELPKPNFRRIAEVLTGRRVHAAAACYAGARGIEQLAVGGGPVAASTFLGAGYMLTAALIYRSIRREVTRAGKVLAALSIGIGIAFILDPSPAAAQEPTVYPKTSVITSPYDGKPTKQEDCPDGMFLTASRPEEGVHCATGTGDPGLPQHAYCEHGADTPKELDLMYMTVDDNGQLACTQEVPITPDPLIDPPAPAPEALTDPGPRHARPDIRIARRDGGYVKSEDCRHTGQLDAGLVVTAHSETCVRGAARHGKPAAVISAPVADRKTARALRLRRLHGRLTFVNTRTVKA